ncbi:conserved hypothetical protein [Klebsiella variicola]|nr:conserved hypothetical protein [Klebsiella variicola]
MEGDRSLSRIYSSPDFIPRNIPAVEWVKGPPRKSIGSVPAGKRLAARVETAGDFSGNGWVPVMERVCAGIETKCRGDG